MTSDKTKTPAWSAEHILDLSDGCARCSGTTLKGVRCRNPINASNRSYSKIILAQIPSVSRNPERLYELLQMLAGCLLCVRYHQKDPRQWIVVIGRWLRSIHHANDEEDERTSERPGTPESETPHRQDESRCAGTPEQEDLHIPEYADASTQTSQQPGHHEPNEDWAKDEKLQRESERREEAKRQSQRERERQQAEARARAEEEARRQQDREQAAREEARRREERRQRDQTKQNIDWEVSWQRYNLQWNTFQQLPSDMAAAQLMKLMPRPVSNASSEHLDIQSPMFEEKVEVFFRHMPGTNVESVGTRMKLRKALMFVEMRRWHPDKITQRFAHLHREDDALKLANGVTQVLTRLVTTL